MTRRVLTASIFLVGFVAIVAFVRAQDDSTHSVLKSIDAEADNPALSSPPSSSSSDSQLPLTTGEEHAGPQIRQATRPSLSERLKQVRESVVRESDATRREAAERLNSVLTDSTVPTRPSSAHPNTVGDNPAPILQARDSYTAPPSTRSSARRANRDPLRSQGTSRDDSRFTQPAVPTEDIAPTYKERNPQRAPNLEQAPPSRTLPPAARGISITSTGLMLTVETAGPEAILVGKSAEYTITVTNHGEVPADNVFVRIGLPDGVEINSVSESAGKAQEPEGESILRKLVWTLDRVERQSKQTLSVVVTPQQNRKFDLMVDWTVRPITSVIQVEVQEPQLKMAVFGPKNVLYGETAVYTIQLTNPGTGTADDVGVEFSYGARSLEKKLLGSLEPGEQREINVELTAQQAGELSVAAIATANGGLRAEAQQDVLVRRAELDLRIIGSSLKYAGGVANYRVSVKNSGNATANGVVASILLPAGAKLLTGSTDEAGRVSQNVGALIPGAERVIALQCQLTVPGENKVQAMASSEGGLEASKAFVTRVDSLADLKLNVSDPRGPTAVGDDAIYEVTIVNRGTKAAEKITIVGQFSEGIEPVKADGVTARLVPGQVLFNPIPRVEPGDEIKLKIIARANQAGNHRFRAKLNCSDPDTQLIAEETTFFFGVDEVPVTASRPSNEETTGQ